MNRRYEQQVSLQHQNATEPRSVDCVVHLVTRDNKIGKAVTECLVSWHKPFPSQLAIKNKDSDKSVKHIRCCQ